MSIPHPLSHVTHVCVHAYLHTSPSEISECFVSRTSRYPTLRVMSHRYVSTHTFTPHPQTHENESCDTCIYATPSESCVLCPHTSSQCTIRHIRMIHVTHISMPHPPSHVTNVYVLIYSHTHPPNIQPTQKDGSCHKYIYTPPSESWHRCTCPRGYRDSLLETAQKAVAIAPKCAHN